MTQVAKGLSVPTTPGDWLRCFRHRVTDEDGAPISLEKLGMALGVSTRTLSRWENDYAQPSPRDLRNFVKYLRLSGFQTAFLYRTFTTMGPDAPTPDPRVFFDRAAPLLRADMPAYLLDTLFYVRGWNSFADELDFLGDSRQAPSHFVKRALSFDLKLAGEGGRSEALGPHMLQTMWLETARHCGSAGYMRMVDELSDLEGFPELWTGLALDESASALPGAPLDFSNDKGRFRLFTSKVPFPPFYYLLQFAPMDDCAWENVSRLRLVGPPTPYYSSVVHWRLG